MNRRTIESKAAARKVFRRFLLNLQEEQGKHKSEKMTRSAAINETVKDTGYCRPTVVKYVKMMEEAQ